MLFKLDEKDGPVRPDVGAGIVGGCLALEPRAVTDALDDAGNVGCDAQLVHLLGHGDIVVRERRVVDDHVLAGVGGALLERIGGAGEQQRVQLGGQQGQQRQQPQGPVRAGDAAGRAAR